MIFGFQKLSGEKAIGGKKKKGKQIVDESFAISTLNVTEQLDSSKQLL